MLQLTSQNHTVTDESALRVIDIRQLAIKRGLDSDNQWVGGYVDYEWEHVRHLFQADELNLLRISPTYH